ncbi:MFS transporter [Pontibacillus marinus]|uniref:MFS transporter n=1 Tax=Pontibacillus marinus BH030004 = DSM 16465 TaxID=1385511 RepID=A0A0A5FZX2_9BACI|nr:MFS transporter [Pontibacillus marinus]KGX84383.1 MFS transporter [Pontibacillus marinus BH030004 = DSM 16465]
MQRELKGALFVFAIGVFMAALDNGIITASLTTLIYAFDVSATWGSWTITLYTLGLAISVPIVGKLSDQFGRKRLFVIEIALFGLGSLLVALSVNFPMFLTARFIQSLGGGGIFIIASSFILNTFPKEKQGRALGVIGGMNGIAAVLGPNVGALILQLTGSWHWLFLINIPIAVLLLLFGVKYINEEQELHHEKMDWAGIFLLTSAILSLMISLTMLEGSNIITSLLQPRFFIFAVLAIVLIATLIRVEKRIARIREPLLPIRLFQTSSFLWTLVLASFSGMILASVIFIPGFLEQYLQIPREQAGYWFTPLAIASGVGAGGGGTLVDKKGPITTLLTASIIAFIGFFLFPLWVETIWQMIIASIFVGLGFGMMLGAPINVLATEKTDERKGVALGTTSLFRQLGMTLAPTLYAGFIARTFSNLDQRTEANLKEKNLPPEGVSGYVDDSAQISEFQTIQSNFQSVSDDQVRDVLLETLQTVVGQGYNGLFYSAMTISALMFIGALYVKKLR